MATEREVILKLKADTTGVDQGLDNVSKGFEDVKKDVDNATKSVTSFEDKLKALDKKVASGEMSMREMTRAVKEYATIALQAGENSPIGKAALQQAGQLKDRIGDLNASVTNLSKDGRGLQTALQLGQGVMGGYSAFQGVTALLGSENENLTKTIMKLQAAQSALMGIEAMRASLEKQSLLRKKLDVYWTDAQKMATRAYNVVVGTSTGLMKALRLAMISTGIGALIVGIGLLIANFDTVTKWVKQAINYFSDLKNVMLLLLGPIGWIIMGYNALKDTERKMDDERAKMHQKNAEHHKARLKQIEEEKKKKIAAIESEIKALDLEKDTLEAQGKSSYAVTLQILEHEKMKLQAILEANNAKIQSWSDYYRMEMKLSGLSEKDFMAQMKGRGIDLESLQAQAIELTKSSRDAIQRAENDITAHKRGEYEKQKEAAQKLANDRIKILQDEHALQMALEDELTKLLIANMADGAEKELAILYDKLDRERDALIAKYGEDSELMAQFEIKKQAELEALYDKFEKARLQKEDEFNQQLTDLRISNMADGREKELTALREKHRQELEELRAKYGVETELEKELLIQQKTELAAIEEEFDTIEQEKKIAKAQETLDTIQGFMTAASEIVGLINELSQQNRDKIVAQRDEDLAQLTNYHNDSIRDLDRKNKSELDNENLTAEQKKQIAQRQAKQKAQMEYNFALQSYNIKKKAAEEEDKIARKQFKRDKAMKIAQIVMDTASGIMKAIAMFGPPPSPLGIAGIAAAGVVGGLQAAVVARQQFQGSAGSIAPPNFADFAVADAGGGASDAGGGAQTGSQQSNVTTSTDSLINGNKSKVILSMVELNSMQNEMNQIEAVSSIGG